MVNDSGGVCKCVWSKREVEIEIINLLLRTTSLGSGRFCILKNLYSALLHCFSNCPIWLLKYPKFCSIFFKK